MFTGNILFNGKIYVPINSLEAYKSATNWSNYADIMVGVVFEEEHLIVDLELNPYSNNPIANRVVANAIKGGVHFRGVYDRLPDELVDVVDEDGFEIDNDIKQIGRWFKYEEDEEGGEVEVIDTEVIFYEGDIIIVSPNMWIGDTTAGENVPEEPTKEYILTYAGDAIDEWHWVELGDVTPAQNLINESLKNYYTKSECDDKFQPKGDYATKDDITSENVIVKGNVENSAILQGEYSVAGKNYSNKAISQVSTSLGAASTAGLKGWYYTKVNLSEKLIWLSDTRSTGILQIIISETTQTTPDNTSFVCGWKVGDEVTIVNDKKYDRCAKIESINGNMIKLDKLPFDSSTIVKSAVATRNFTEPDEFSITAIRINDDSLLKTLTVSSYDKGNVDFGGGAHAEGIQTYALNIGAHAEGIQTIAYGQYSHTEGFKTQAGYASHAEGRETAASGTLSHAEGRESVASGAHSHAEGRKTVASNLQSHAEGEGSVASGPCSHAEGDTTTASGNQAHSEGKSTIASGSTSHAEGYVTEARGIVSHAEGYKSQAQGSGSHAEGGYYINSTNNEVGGIASGNASHAEGINTNASGLASHAEGKKTKSSNNHSHAEGFATEALGAQSHTEGNITIAKGSDTHAEGKRTFAFGAQSHAEGFGSNSPSDDAINAENAETIKIEWESTKRINVATGIASHVEGRNNLAYGDRSHAGGYQTAAIGTTSFAHGNNVKTTNENEVAFGKFNLSSKNTTLFSIGNGTSDSSRKNVLEIDKSGIAKFDNSIYTKNIEVATKNDINNILILIGKLENRISLLEKNDSCEWEGYDCTPETCGTECSFNECTDYECDWYECAYDACEDVTCFNYTCEAENCETECSLNECPDYECEDVTCFDYTCEAEYEPCAENEPCSENEPCDENCGIYDESF
jgi:hypothetical protein